MNTADHNGQAEQSPGTNPPGPDDRPQPETSTAPSTAEDRTRIPWQKWGLHEKGPVPPCPKRSLTTPPAKPTFASGHARSAGSECHVTKRSTRSCRRAPPSGGPAH